MNQALALGFKTIAELDQAFAENGKLVVRMGAYMVPETINHRFTLTCLLDVIGGRMGGEAYWDAVKDAKGHGSSRGWCDDMARIYGHITSY